MQNHRLTILTVLITALFTMLLSGCSGAGSAPMTKGDPGEAAATVNGKAIKLEEVERVIKQQGQGQESKLSQLELTATRLQILQGLIQDEVLFQKAEKEGTVPTDEEVTAEYNRTKQQSGLSAERFEEEMKKAGQTDASVRENLKKGIAVQRLIDKITGKIEPPKDSEVEAFFNSNPESFKNKRGAQLAAIVIDPVDNGEGDTTKNEVEAQQKAKDVGQRALQGADFASLARENSEDPNTRMSGGDWRYFTEDEMKQTFGTGFADFVMTKMQVGQVVPQAIPLQGKILILKLQSRLEKDEDQTLESPKVRPQIIEYLMNQRKELLKQSYAAIAMNEAKIENYLAKKVVENPNELSGARPAGAVSASTPANVNSANTNVANTSTNSPANANSVANANADAKRAASANANAAR